jgi:TonB family protein
LKYGLGIEDSEKIARYELIEYSNGFYLGQIKNGKRDGYGTYLWYATEDDDICFYSGYWKDGDFNGDGFWCKSNSQSYCGSFENGKCEGLCHFCNLGQLVFSAEFKNGEIIRVTEARNGFTFNGKHYDSTMEEHRSSRSNVGSGCLGLLVIILIIWGCFKFCGSSQNNNSESVNLSGIGQAIVTANIANLRTGPGTDYDYYLQSDGTKVQVKKGEYIEVLEDGGDWFKIMTPDGGTAYIKKTLCSDIELYQPEGDTAAEANEQEETATVEDKIVGEGEANDTKMEATLDVEDTHYGAESIPNQVVEQSATEEGVKDIVDQMPSFPRGGTALMQFISSNVKYPRIAEEKGVQGRVICTFVVEKDGSISHVQVARSVDPSLDKEAVRVIMSMPKWIPGKQDGVPVRVKYTVPVTFRLQ